LKVTSKRRDLIGILVNLKDYTMGADKGGAVAMFDDFDIDYNQYKYLIETRCSGTLTKWKSAVVIEKVQEEEEQPSKERRELQNGKILWGNRLC
jgi:hypothetical protein